MAQILIHSQHYKNNLNHIICHIGSKDKLALVLKDNAYGHGLEIIAPLAQECGIKSVFVKNAPEAQKIAHLFDHITFFYGKAPAGLGENIHPVVQNFEQISQVPKGSSVELKVNIGMNRNGADQRDLAILIEKILESGLHLFGVFAHNGYGDEKDAEFENSLQRFKDVKAQVRQICDRLGIAHPRFHSLSSSGALRTQKIDDDLVRIGIAAYGYVTYSFPHPLVSKLKPILSLWADKITTLKLQKGAKIGYGGMSVLEQDSWVSTYDLGYGDGLFRHSKKEGKLFTHDGYEILPKMSMDCFSAICTKDRICVFEDASRMSEFFNTIPYEILVKLSPFLPRALI